MRYSALASTVLLAAAGAPALALPVAIRSTDEAPLVERDLLNKLAEREYHGVLEARRHPPPRTPSPPPPHTPSPHPPPSPPPAPPNTPTRHHGRSYYEILKRGILEARRHPPPRTPEPPSPPRPAPNPPSPPPAPPNTPTHRGRREYYEIIARELEDGLVEREYYDELVSRALEARRHPPPRTPSPPPPHTPSPHPPPSPPPAPPNTPTRHHGRSDYEWFARDFDLDGELFERGFEIDELD